MPHADSALPLRHALALGVVHGPAELLPISSSGHVILLPWLAGWPYERLDAGARKSFEVALHAGAALVLAPWLAREALARGGGARRAALMTVASAPPALAGLAFERPVERLGRPDVVALGLLAGAAAMVVADRTPGTRPAADVGVGDALALGLAQAVALVPGISRSGATLAVGRARGFHRAAAGELSRQAGLPVLVGAAALKGWRLARDGPPPGVTPALAAGALAALASTLAALPLGRHARAWPLGGFALYRGALAVLVLRRLHGENAAMRESAHRAGNGRP